MVHIEHVLYGPYRSCSIWLHVPSPLRPCALARKGGPGGLAPQAEGLGGPSAPPGKQGGLGGGTPPNGDEIQDFTFLSPFRLLARVNPKRNEKRPYEASIQHDVAEIEGT